MAKVAGSLCRNTAPGVRGTESPERILTNCHLQRNTRFVRTIIQRDGAVAGVVGNPYIERKMRGPTTKLDVVAGIVVAARVLMSKPRRFRIMRVESETSVRSIYLYRILGCS